MGACSFWIRLGFALSFSDPFFVDCNVVAFKMLAEPPAICCKYGSCPISRFGYRATYGPYWNSLSDYDWNRIDKQCPGPSCWAEPLLDYVPAGAQRSYSTPSLIIPLFKLRTFGDLSLCSVWLKLCNSFRISLCWHCNPYYYYLFWLWYCSDVLLFFGHSV